MTDHPTDPAAGAAPAEPAQAARPTLGGHLSIIRADHWFKNVFVLPGVVVALGIVPELASWDILPRLGIGLASVCLIASSNYVLNELVDAEFDRHHPSKRHRPVPAGKVSIPLGYVQWLMLMALGLGLGWLVSPRFTATMGALWVMGCAYNVRPVRTKDLPYLDVISEAVNNPLRMLAGWYVVITAAEPLPPTTLLVSYWMVGCYFMALKRFAEYRKIGDPGRAAAYRKSFGLYDENRLLVSIMFYAATAMLFFGAFLMRYRMELILSFPLVAWVMAQYLELAFKDDSPVQNPEGLYKEKGLMLAVVLCTVVLGVLFFVDLPWLEGFFVKSAT